MRLGFRDISISLNLKDGSSKQILHGVSGECTSGRTCALMGPSGAGKTTLVSVCVGECFFFDPSLDPSPFFWKHGERGEAGTCSN